MNPEETPVISPPRSPIIPVLMVVCLLLLMLSTGLVYKLSTMTAPATDTMVKEPEAKEITVPPGAVKISGCIPHEGEHWVELDKLPNGPFYVTDKGQVTAIEYMFTDQSIPGNDFAHKSFPDEMAYMTDKNMNLSGLVKELEKPFILPDVKIKSWSIHWTPPHAGITIPHYDMHMYIVDRPRLETVCPDATFDNVLPHDVYDQMVKLGVPVPNMGAPDATPPATIKPSPTR